MTYSVSHKSSVLFIHPFIHHFIPFLPFTLIFTYFSLSLFRPPSHTLLIRFLISSGASSCRRRYSSDSQVPSSSQWISKTIAATLLSSLVISSSFGGFYEGLFSIMRKKVCARAGCRGYGRCRMQLIILSCINQR